MSPTIRTLLAALLLAPAAARAQTGRIAGTITEAGGAPLAGTQVVVVATNQGASTDADGRYAITNVAPGTYVLRALRIGYRPKDVPAVVVRPGEETRLDVTLDRAPLELAGVVVSASRRVEKVTDAPATITRIDAVDIENTVGNSFAPALKAVKGVDFIQIGVTAAAINARGFNSSFNNRMLMMEDGRIAVLPENGLPVGTFTTTPKIDLAGIEVLVGPGSALYGPDASNGVLTLQTKDPRQFPGTTVEVSAGSRSFYDVQARHAAVIGNIGYKITGEYQSANDWENRNVYAPISATAPPSPELNADFNTDVLRGAGALAWYLPASARLELNAGASRSNGIGQTNVGRNQLIDWQYRHYQLRFTHPNWYGQVYRTQSLSGDTYQLNGFAQNRLRFPAISDDSVRSLSDFPAEGTLNAAEIQNTFSIPMTFGTQVTWGGQFRRDQVSSKRQWLSDRKTGEDIEVDQRGVYAQLEQPVGPAIRLIAAGRYDKHDYYDAQWSPKGGILFTPIIDQTFRLTFNRAFKSPTILQTSFFFPNFSPGIGLIGNRNGLTVQDGSGNIIRTIQPIEPETNDTWELGYKGVLRGKLYVDVTGYLSDYENFMSPLIVLNNPFAVAPAVPTFVHDLETDERFVDPTTGSQQIALTYVNLGKATIYGTDIGLRYLLTPRVGVSGTASFQKLDKVETQPTDPPEATAFNAPDTKWNVGMDFADVFRQNLLGSFTVRYVNGYRFRSGVNFGR
ncbi:MAG TPA: TonB-dependent receptor, partial [Gemmatimonadaceae bacterium]|nr:TonB-dependent receptor [Gemmatimonadaceae bacterium]